MGGMIEWLLVVVAALAVLTFLLVSAIRDWEEKHGPFDDEDDF